MIPAFALGRTQDLLHELRKLLDAGEIPPVKVYVDSPLATSATEIFRKHQAFFDFETRTMLEEGRSPFEFAGLHYTQSVEDSKRLNDIRGGAIIISPAECAMWDASSTISGTTFGVPRQRCSSSATKLKGP